MIETHDGTLRNRTRSDYPARCGRKRARSHTPGYDRAVLSRLRRLQPGTLIALLALFVSLGGTAAAVSLITGRNVKDGSLTGRDIRDGSIAGNDLESALTRGSRGPAGSVGPAGPVGEPGLRGPQGVAGVAGADPWDSIPSGQLVTGSQTLLLEAGPNSTTPFQLTIPLPARAPNPLTQDDVQFTTSLLASPANTDANCAGSDASPAPQRAGLVCIYPTTVPAAVNVVSGSAYGDIVPDRSSGVSIVWNALTSPSPSTNPSATGFSFVWAYRAP